MSGVSIIDSLRVLGAMARITAPTVLDMVRETLDRETVDERARWFGRKVVEVLGVDLVATGANQVATDRAYVYMSNHQSHLDIPMLYATLPSPTIRMLAKKELFQIPVWGTGLRAAEFIEVDRSNPVRSRESIARAADAYDQTAKLLAAAKTNDLGNLKAAFGQTAQACKSCHDHFRGD